MDKLSDDTIAHYRKILGNDPPREEHRVLASALAELQQFRAERDKQRLAVEAKDDIIAAGQRTIDSGNEAFRTLREQWWAERDKLRAELEQLRAAKAADRERVREAVMRIAVDILEHPETKIIRSYDTADAIAIRVADALAVPVCDRSVERGHVFTVTASAVRDRVASVAGWTGFSPGSIDRMITDIANRVADTLSRR